MKTSNEIKQFVIERLEAKDPMSLYFEFFNQIKEENSVLGVKAILSRWQCACREASKEKGWKAIDETFPRSIFCWNAAINAINRGGRESDYRKMKQTFGWDVKAIADGKHCTIAQIIIDALQEAFARKEKERLGLNDESCQEDAAL